MTLFLILTLGAGAIIGFCGALAWLDRKYGSQMAEVVNDAIYWQSQHKRLKGEFQRFKKYLTEIEAIYAPVVDQQLVEQDAKKFADVA